MPELARELRIPQVTLADDHGLQRLPVAVRRHSLWNNAIPGVTLELTLDTNKPNHSPLELNRCRPPNFSYPAASVAAISDVFESTTGPDAAAEATPCAASSPATTAATTTTPPPTTL